MAKELDESVYREIEPSRSRQEDGRESFYLITTNLGELFSPLKASKNSLKRGELSSYPLLALTRRVETFALYSAELKLIPFFPLKFSPSKTLAKHSNPRQTSP